MESICVIGASSIDLVGRSKALLKRGDSNVGAIEFNLGGVARNIAENLYRLNADSRLITFLADDEFSMLVIARLNQIQLDFFFPTINGSRTCQYVAIHNQDGRLQYGINDFSLMDSLRFSDVAPYLPIIESSDILVLDANLPEEILIKLGNQFANKRIFVDGVSQAKVIRIKAILGLIEVLKVNVNELLALVDDESLTKDEAIRSLSASGIRHLLVTDAKREIAYTDQMNIYHTLPLKPKHIVSSVGAGDALFAGVIFGMANGLSFQNSLQIGKRLARDTMETHLACNPNVNSNQFKLVRSDLV